MSPQSGELHHNSAGRVHRLLDRRGGAPTAPLLLAASAFLVAASGDAINDFFDASLDAVNKPWRPIPSGAISTGAALVAAIAAPRSLYALIPAAYALLTIAGRGVHST